MKHRFVCIALLAGILGLFAAGAAAGGNLVTNGGFEKANSGWRWINSRNAKASWQIDTNVSHSGRASCRITNASKLSPYVYCEVYQEIKNVKPVVAQQKVHVRAGISKVFSQKTLWRS